MSKTKAVREPSDYLNLLEKSALLSAGQLQEARRLAAESSDARSLARQLVKERLLTSWQASQLLAGWSSLTIGKYRLCRQLGRSHVARVFLARHSQMNRQVALKSLSRRYTSEPDVVKQFLADARTAASLDHRNLIHVYDVDSADDRYFLVMEHVEGRDLERVLEEEGPLAPARAADMIRQAAGGLHYAHERGMVHRDVKPANLMVDDQGTVKILGLGLGQLSDLDHEAAADHEFEMDCGFPAPEVEGHGEAGPKSDIYALGATFYCLLTGKPPTRELGARDVLRQRRDLPEDLARICVRMMARSPEKRYATAGEVVEALDEWLLENAPVEEVVDEDVEVVQAGGTAEPAGAFDWAPDAGGSELPAHVAERLQRRRRRKKTRTESPAAESAPKTDVEESESPAKTAAKARSRKSAKSTPKANKQTQPAETSARKGLPLGLLIGGGAAAVVVAGLLLALVLFFVLGSGGDTGDGDSQLAAVNAADGEAIGDDPLETDPEDPLETDPEDPLETDPPDPLETDPGNPPASGSGPDAGDPASPAEQPKPAADQPAAEGVAPSTPDDGQPAPGQTDSPQDTQSPQPAAQPGGDTPAESEPEQAKPEDAKPEDAKPEDAKPEDAAPEETKPAPEPQPEPKPFAGFPKVVSLPVPEEGKPAERLELGPVQIPEDRICYIKLRGGGNAIKGTSSFEMKNARNGTAERDWEVFLLGAKSGGGDALKVADLTIQDGRLLFQWTAEASAEPDAGALRNCALSMNVGPEIHELVLRQPEVQSPLVVDLDKPEDKHRVDIPLPPDPSSVRFQVTKLEGPFPPHVLEPDAPIPPVKGEQTIKLGAEPAEQVLELHLEIELKRDLEVTVAPHFRVSTEGKPVPMTKANLRKVEQQAVLLRGQLLAQLNDLTQLQKRLQDQAQKQRATAEINLKQQQLVQVETGIQALEKLKGLYDQLNEQGKIHYRVVYDAEGVEVELARSE